MAQAAKVDEAELYKSEKCRRIVSYNFKGGVGKTTTVYNLAWQLAVNGHKVLVIDADPQCNLTIHLQERARKDPEADEDERSPYAPHSGQKRKKSKLDDGAGSNSQETPASANSQVSSLEAGPEAKPYELPRPEFYLEPFKRDGEHNIRDQVPQEAENHYSTDDLVSQNADFTLHTALDDYMPGSFPQSSVPLKDASQYFGENVSALQKGGKLYFLPGSFRVSEIDWSLGKLDFSPPKHHGAKWACWHHLMKRCEEEYGLDFIFVDLNPSASKLNCLAILSCEYILPPVGVGSYDLSSSYEMITYGLAQAVNLGNDILKVQHVNDQATAVATKARDFKTFAERSNGVWPSIPKGTPTLPRMPYLLPFLVQKYKTANAFNGYQRRRMTKAAAGAVHGLRDLVARAYTSVDQAGAGDFERNVNTRLRGMYYYSLSVVPAPQGLVQEMAKAMVIPFIGITEKLNSVSHEMRKPVCLLDMGQISDWVANMSLRDQRTFTWELEYLQHKYKLLAEALCNLKRRN